jgi:hypothetical protein
MAGAFRIREKVLLTAVWMLFVGDLLWLAPSRLPSPLQLFVRAVVFDTSTFDPSILGLFYATGVVVTLHASFVWAEEYESRPHPIALVLLGNALGSVFFLPFYAWRRTGPKREGPPPWPASKALRWILVLELAAALAYASIAGSFAALRAEVTGRWFSHYLVIDFVVLSLLLLVHARGRARR